MGLKLVEVKMKPIDPEEVVHDRYHHGRIIGTEDPNLKGYPPNQGCVMLSSDAYFAVGEERPERRMVGFTFGHTSYEWIEDQPK